LNLVLRLNQETCAPSLHVSGVDRTWRHPTSRLPDYRVPGLCDHPRSSAPCLLLLPRSSSLHAMPHLPPTHHETSKYDSLNETKIKEKQNKTIPNSNSNIAKSMTHHNQTKELTTWFLKTPKLSHHYCTPCSPPRLLPLQWMDFCSSSKLQPCLLPCSSSRLQPCLLPSSHLLQINFSPASPPSSPNYPLRLKWEQRKTKCTPSHLCRPRLHQWGALCLESSIRIWRSWMKTIEVTTLHALVPSPSSQLSTSRGGCCSYGAVLLISGHHCPSPGYFYGIEMTTATLVLWI
jgi:hypothetical protein